MKIFFRGHNYRYELEHVVRTFCENVSLEIIEMKKKDRKTGEDYVYFRLSGTSLCMSLFVVVCYDHKEVGVFKRCGYIPDNNTAQQMFAVMFFDIMSGITGKRPVWGILTGVRPVNFVKRMTDAGYSEKQIKEELEEKYRVKSTKALIAIETAKRAKRISLLNTKDSYSLYISIPFCPSRCRYCSFVSKTVEREGSLVAPYLDRLSVELKRTAEIAKETGLILKTIYIGGGTPTVLTPDELIVLCRTVSENFPVGSVLEYTVEAGRPDTITTDKLKILDSCGVSRISINPQTFNDDILRAVSRGHTSKEIETAFESAKRAGFSNINADLIAGLPGDTLNGFGMSLKKLLTLMPQSITVHALTLKRASLMSEQKEKFSDDAEKMIDFAYTKLKDHQYFPYYMYRQKGTVDGLENIGYAKEGFEGLYNVFIMEELHTILSCGAGGVTKTVDRENGKVERTFNYKYPLDYMEKFDEVIKRKESVRYRMSKR